MILKIFILVFSLCQSGYSLQDIPDFIKICHKSDPTIKGCIIDAIHHLRPQLKNGNEEYDIPSVEPIVINDLIDETSGGLHLQTTNVVAYGGGDFIIDDITVDFDKYQFHVIVLIAQLAIEAKYRMDGKLVMLPVRGDGTFTGNLTDIRADSTLSTKIIEKDGQKYMHFIDNKLKITLGGGKVRFENLFNGDKTINKMVNDVINDNFQVFAAELVPYVERALGKTVIDTANRIIGPYTIEQLFPE